MTTAPLDSLDERIRCAIAEKRLLEIRYKRAIRLAEPHDYGVIDGTERLLIFQLHGPDSGKGAVGWRLLDVVKIERRREISRSTRSTDPCPKLLMSSITSSNDGSQDSLCLGILSRMQSGL
jgi:hypothetical protein